MQALVSRSLLFNSFMKKRKEPIDQRFGINKTKKGGEEPGKMAMLGLLFHDSRSG
jgi:hypothetical protein